MDHTSLIPNVSATLAPQAASISLAHGGEPRAGLARGHDVAQAERARIDPELARAGGQVGGEGERAEDRGDAEPRDQLEQPARLAGADGHHGRAARLERHVVGDAAGVERVVEAVGHHVVRPQPAIRNASPPTALFASWSARVKPTATGSPVVPEVTCMRTRRSRGGAQLRAEGRIASAGPRAAPPSW